MVGVGGSRWRNAMGVAQVMSVPLPRRKRAGTGDDGPVPSATASLRVCPRYCTKYRPPVFQACRRCGREKSGSMNWWCEECVPEVRMLMRAGYSMVQVAAHRDRYGRAEDAEVAGRPNSRELAFCRREIGFLHGATDSHRKAAIKRRAERDWS